MKPTNFDPEHSQRVAVGTSSGSSTTSGVTAHADLTGLTGDDHTQYETTTEGGQGKVFAHGSMGTTETLDPTDGNVHTGTLNANCTVTMSAPPTTRGGYTPSALIEFWVTQDGTGGRTITFAATGGTVTDDGTITPSTTAGVTVRYILERVPGTTNDWIRNLVGGGGSTSPLTTKGDLWGYDTADARVPVGTNTYLLVADSTDAQGVVWKDPQTTGHYEPLMDGGSPYAPLDDGTGTDWLFVWVT